MACTPRSVPGNGLPFLLSLLARTHSSVGQDRTARRPLGFPRRLSPAAPGIWLRASHRQDWARAFVTGVLLSGSLAGPSERLEAARELGARPFPRLEYTKHFNNCINLKATSIKLVLRVPY